MDQSLFAAPHGLSQRITSFIACACQGIHQLPLIHLIVLIANAHPRRILQTHPRFRSKGRKTWPSRHPCGCCRRPSLANDMRGNNGPVTFYNQTSMRCHRRVRSDPYPQARRCTARSDLQDQLLEIMSESARSGNAHRQILERPSQTPEPPHPLKDTKPDLPNRQQDIRLELQASDLPRTLCSLRPARPSRASNGSGLKRRDPDPCGPQSQHLEASRHIFSSQWFTTGIRLQKPMQTGSSLLGYRVVRHPPGRS